ncbi:MAG: GNAT family N-acetyltransferase [Burkholderiales bacterium]
MSVTYALEAWPDVVGEMVSLWSLHWTEVALDHDRVPLDPDLELYRAMHNAGALHVVVARREGRVIGYHISIVKTHLHYRSTLHALVDIYFVDPAERKGMVGIKLLREAERLLKQRGVVKIISATKVHTSCATGRPLDMAKIFLRLGWKEAERTFVKCI